MKVIRSLKGPTVNKSSLVGHGISHIHHQCRFSLVDGNFEMFEVPI